jgi:putative DNA primase/helicase
VNYSSALQSCPACCDREQWIRVLASAKAAGLPEHECRTWSESCPDQFDAKNWNSTWKSLKTDKGITAGTLVRYAKDHGWTPSNDADGYTKPKAIKSVPRPVAPQAKPAKPLIVDTFTSEEYGESDKWNPSFIWNNRCEPASYDHGYITSKEAAGVPLENLRMVSYDTPHDSQIWIQKTSMAGALVVPVYANGVLQTLQFVTTGVTAAKLKAAGKPSKLNLPGREVVGWHIVGEFKPLGRAFLVEGIGTAWAVWKATGDAAIVTFGSGRFGAVAQAISAECPGLKLVICPDVGKESDCAEIASRTGASMVTLPEGWGSNADLCDFALRDGFDALEDHIYNETREVEPPPPPEPHLKLVSVADVVTNPSKPPEFVWGQYLPRGVVILLGAHGGIGKSTIALMLCAHVALGRPMFGAPTTRVRALFLSLEDSTAIVRHRLGFICKTLQIDPSNLEGQLVIADGTENPELFTCENRGTGAPTATHAELLEMVKEHQFGLVIVDNASDAYGGDEIVRRQVRAFMRQLGQVAKSTNCAVVLLAHVDKQTSRSRKSEGGEGYSGSTAWHNSARSRLFLTRDDSGLLTLEHQKSNLGLIAEAITLVWPHGGLPMLADADAADSNPMINPNIGREDDRRAAGLLALMAEFEGRGQFTSPAITSRNNVFAVLSPEPAFKRLRMSKEDVKRIVNQCQRAGWIESIEFRTKDRKVKERWTVTESGRLFMKAPTAPTAPTG